MSSMSPGQYNIPGLGSESMKKAYIESTRRGAFGTTSVRIAPMIKKGATELPGPSHYQVSDKVNKPRYKQLSSNFASMTSRLSEPPSTVKIIGVRALLGLRLSLIVPIALSLTLYQPYTGQGRRSTGTP
ncbi:hypothetical protein LSH36_217g00006 [Paralvinella palmiformis]|uniref:Uncharacterized protein n=1 Tax=Paralvinella palmiformis TaxID=53620 RepID=A0AAD9JNF5_9ANNE|nr:hypothetical protein LSH36_217g00006 [Paralvinella palmiformis]